MNASFRASQLSTKLSDVYHVVKHEEKRYVDFIECPASPSQMVGSQEISSEQASAIVVREKMRCHVNEPSCDYDPNEAVFFICSASRSDLAFWNKTPQFDLFVCMQDGKHFFVYSGRTSVCKREKIQAVEQYDRMNGTTHIKVTTVKKSRTFQVRDEHKDRVKAFVSFIPQDYRHFVLNMKALLRRRTYSELLSEVKDEAAKIGIVINDTRDLKRTFEILVRHFHPDVCNLSPAECLTKTQSILIYRNRWKAFEKARIFLDAKGIALSVDVDVVIQLTNTKEENSQEENSEMELLRQEVRHCFT